jgi:hypothetical protein
MSILKKSIGVIARRPFVLIFPATLILILSFANLYNPLPALMGLFEVTDTKIFNAVASLIKYLLEPNVLFFTLALTTGLLLLLSLIVSFILSGYLFVFHNSYLGKSSCKGEFLTGVKKYYFRVLYGVFVLLFSILLLVFFVFVASVPSVVVTESWRAGETQLLPVIIFVNALTITVLSALVIFYHVYTAFWFPAIYNSESKSFRLAVHVAGKGVWKTALWLLIFDGIFIITMIFNKFINNLIMNQANGNIFLLLGYFILDCLLKSYIFILFLCMLFTMFNALSSKKKK